MKPRPMHKLYCMTVQLACTMIEYLSVSYTMLVSSPNGLANDFRTVDRWFDTHSVLKKVFISPARRLFEKSLRLSSRRLVNGRYFSRRRIVWSLLSTNINQSCRCITSSPWCMEVIPWLYTTVVVRQWY